MLSHSSQVWRRKRSTGSSWKRCVEGYNRYICGSNICIGCNFEQALWWQLMAVCIRQSFGAASNNQMWLLAQTIVFQVRKNEKEADLKPVTPSKIPVGTFRVEEEKAINRAINGGPTNGSMDSNRQSSERAISPAPPSRIPKFSSKLGANYKRVQVS